LSREQDLLFIALALKIVDLAAALLQLLILRHEQGRDHEPKSDEEKKLEDAI
jgi:hypothetical protein